MNFKSAFYPEDPRNKATHVNEGFIMGWVPGIITSIEDTEGIGRIRAKCPIFDESKDIPNGEDYYIWVCEEFTENGVKGGTHRMLKLGTQVALIPMFGDPTQMLMIGCLPNREDRPHPDFDRSKGTYGKATAAGNIEFNDDTDGTKINHLISGIDEVYSGKGDYTISTRDDAILSLHKEGDVFLSNPKSSLNLSKEGDAAIANLTGSGLSLDSEGNVNFHGKDGASLNLSEKAAQLVGPSRRFAIALQKLRGFLSTELQKAQDQIVQLSRYTEQFKDGKIQASTYVNRCAIVTDFIRNEFSSSIPENIEALEELGEVLPNAIAEILAPQIKYAQSINLPEIVEVAESSLSEDAEATIDTLIENIPEAIAKLLLPEKRIALEKHLKSMVPVLAALRFDPKLQRDFLVAELVPNGWKSVDCIFAMGLESKVLEIENAINPGQDTITGATVEQERQWFDSLPNAVESAKSILGAGDVEYGSGEVFDFPVPELLDTDLFSIIPWKTKTKTDKDKTKQKDWLSLLGAFPSQEAKSSIVLGESLFSLLLGDLLLARIKKMIEVLRSLEDKRDIAQSASRLYPVAIALSQSNVFREKDQLIKSLENASDYFDVDLSHKDIVFHATYEFLPKAIALLEDELLDTLKSLKSDFTDLINSIPPITEGAGITAQEDFAQLQTPQGDWGAIARVGKDSAQVFGPQPGINPGNRSVLYAEKDSAGMKANDKGGIARVAKRLSEVLGPESENGERTKLFAYEEEAGLEYPNGGLMYVDKGISQLLGPLVDDKIRTSILTDVAEAVMFGGGLKGAIAKVSEELFKAIGPDGKKLIEISESILKAVGGDGGSILQLAEEFADILGPDGQKALKIGREVLEVIGGGINGGSVLRLTENLSQLLGPDGQKALMISQDILEVIGGGINGGSVLKLTETLAELLGPGGQKALKIGMSFLQLLGPGGSAVKLLEQGLEILGIDGSSGLKIFEGITSLLGSGGVSLSISPSGISSQGFNGGGFSFSESKSVVSAVGKTVFRSGDALGSKGSGIILDGGSAAIASFYPGEWNIISNDSEASDQLGNEKFRIIADDDGIKLQALLQSGGVLQELVLNRDRVEINGYNTENLSSLEGEISSLRSLIADLDTRVSELESENQE
jgi:hypothetical protein